MLPFNGRTGFKGPRLEASNIALDRFGQTYTIPCIEQRLSKARRIEILTLT